MRNDKRERLTQNRKGLRKPIPVRAGRVFIPSQLPKSFCVLREKHEMV